MTVFKRDVDPTCEMDPSAKYFYDEGQESYRTDKNPYNRKSQIMAFHCWSAGHCDRWGELPNE